ncbi:hypothetical protein M758_UG145900 [Ceratodon purpureus]|nr:hypothetical protein M758_UG145900 [Ceratodon purpureus]
MFSEHINMYSAALKCNALIKLYFICGLGGATKFSSMDGLMQLLLALCKPS